MKRKRWGRLALAAAAVIVAPLAAALTASAIWKQQSQASLAAGSQVIQTARGPVEYAEVGSGPVVLISHGAPGGYDEGVVLARLAQAPQYQFIGVSRPGYLRTPLETGRTYEEQADAFAALLDALGVEKAAVLGVSSGGPAALQFALRYPERCWALVMLAAVSQRPEGPPPPLDSWLWKAATSDFGSWMLDSVLEYQPGPLLLAMMPDDPAERSRLLDDPQNLAAFQEALRTAIPVSLRSVGLANDMDLHWAMPEYPLHEISVPTLAIYGTGDVQVDWPNAQFVADEIPGAEFAPVEGGSHALMITHRAEVWPRLMAFLDRHAP